MKRRLDVILVERQLAESRQIAQALIMAGRVSVDGMPAGKAGMRIAEDVEVAVSGPALPFVSRGGVKLAGALDDFSLEVIGLRALDVGASTGGFTDCLLQRGAEKVYALDVGHGQIDWSLRNDPRVSVIEKLNARYLSPEDLPTAVAMVVIDVSFISLRHVLPRIPAVMDRIPAGPPSGRGSIVALVKPQFEVGRRQVGRGGIVRSREKRLEALETISRFAISMGLGVAALAPSRLTGAEGNQEYFLHLRVGGSGLTVEEIHRNAAQISIEEGEQH